LHTAEREEGQLRALRDEDQRVLAAELRGFGLLVLSLNGNHHDVDPYLLYFPRGYSYLRRLPAAGLLAFGHELLSKLAEERARKLLARREELQEALTRFALSQETWAAARSAREQAFAIVQGERRAWARGVFKARALATIECHFERAYVRGIFAGTAERRRRVKAPLEVVEAPREVVMPQLETVSATARRGEFAEVAAGTAEVVEVPPAPAAVALSIASRGRAGSESRGDPVVNQRRDPAAAQPGTPVASHPGEPGDGLLVTPSGVSLVDRIAREELHGRDVQPALADLALVSWKT
jgi:hypothetical protein